MNLKEFLTKKKDPRSLKEGLIKKGGVNAPPETPRPSTTPIGQGHEYGIAYPLSFEAEEERRRSRHDAMVQREAEREIHARTAPQQVLVSHLHADYIESHHVGPDLEAIIRTYAREELARTGMRERLVRIDRLEIAMFAVIVTAFIIGLTFVIVSKIQG